METNEPVKIYFWKCKCGNIYTCGYEGKFNRGYCYCNGRECRRTMKKRTPQFRAFIEDGLHEPLMMEEIGLSRNEYLGYITKRMVAK